MTKMQSSPLYLASRVMKVSLLSISGSIALLLSLILLLMSLLFIGLFEVGFAISSDILPKLPSRSTDASVIRATVDAIISIGMSIVAIGFAYIGSRNFDLARRIEFAARNPNKFARDALITIDKLIGDAAAQSAQIVAARAFVNELVSKSLIPDAGEIKSLSDDLQGL